MKYLPLLFIALILSCTEETPETLVYQKERPYANHPYEVIGNVKTITQKYYEDVADDDDDPLPWVGKKDEKIQLTQETTITFNVDGFPVLEEMYEFHETESYETEIILSARQKWKYNDLGQVTSNSWGSDALGDTLMLWEFQYNDFNQLKYIIQSIEHSKKEIRDTTFAYFKLDTLTNKPIVDIINYDIRGDVRELNRSYLDENGYTTKKQKYNESEILVEENIYDERGNEIEGSAWERNGEKRYRGVSVYDSLNREIYYAFYYKQDNEPSIDSISYTDNKVIKKKCGDLHLQTTRIDQDISEIIDDNGCEINPEIREYLYDEVGNTLSMIYRSYWTTTLQQDRWGNLVLDKNYMVKYEYIHVEQINPKFGYKYEYTYH